MAFGQTRLSQSATCLIQTKKKAKKETVKEQETSVATLAEQDGSTILYPTQCCYVSNEKDEIFLSCRITEELISKGFNY